MRRARGPIGPVLRVAMVLIAACGCDNGGGGAGSYRAGEEAGQLRAASARSQEAQRQSLAMLMAEHARAARLSEELAARRHVESILSGVGVLCGCALASTCFALIRRRRASP